MRCYLESFFLFFVFIGSIPIPITAQNAVTLGLQGGHNNAKARHLNVGTTSKRSGIVAGGFVEIIPPNSLISYQVEFHYLQKGAYIKGDTSRVRFKFNYLEIPLLLRSTARNDGIKPFVFAGPKIGILLSAIANIKTTSLSESRDLKKDTKPIDFSLDMGIGFEYAFGQTCFFGAARYSLGLVDIDKSSRGEWYSRDFQITAGTKIDLK